MKRKGYLWHYYGFTRLHLWGVHIVSGAFGAIGAGVLFFALSRLMEDAPAAHVTLLLTISGIAFLGCIATVAASMLALLFFWGAHQLHLLEEEKPPDDEA